MLFWIFFETLSLNVKMYLWLKWYTVPFFVSGQTYKISKGSNKYCSHCIYGSSKPLHDVNLKGQIFYFLCNEQSGNIQCYIIYEPLIYKRFQMCSLISASWINNTLVMANVCSVFLRKVGIVHHTDGCYVLAGWHLSVKCFWNTFMNGTEYIQSIIMQWIFGMGFWTCRMAYSLQTFMGSLLWAKLVYSTAIMPLL